MSNITDYRLVLYERLASQKLNEILSQINSHNHGSAGGVVIDTTNAIADKSIAGSKLADGAVDTLQLADGAISTVKVANGSITEDKMSFSYQTSYQTEERSDDISNSTTASYSDLDGMTITYTSNGSDAVKITFNAPFRCRMISPANDSWMMVNLQVDGAQVRSTGWWTGSYGGEAVTISSVISLFYVGVLPAGDRIITVGWKSGGGSMYQDGATTGSRCLIVE